MIWSRFDFCDFSVDGGVRTPCTPTPGSVHAKCWYLICDWDIKGSIETIRIYHESEGGIVQKISPENHLIYINLSHKPKVACQLEVANASLSYPSFISCLSYYTASYYTALLHLDLINVVYIFYQVKSTVFNLHFLDDLDDVELT